MTLNSPELNCSIVFPLYCLIVSKKTDHFLRDFICSERDGADGSMSIHFLSCIGMILGVSTSSLFCGFAFAFDLAAITLTLGCGAFSSGRPAETSVLLYFESTTYSIVPRDILTQD